MLVVIGRGQVRGCGLIEVGYLKTAIKTIARLGIIRAYISNRFIYL